MNDGCENTEEEGSRSSIAAVKKSSESLGL